MDLIEGPNLAEVFKHQQGLTLDQISAVFVPICSALDYAHKKGIIHRDIKREIIKMDEHDMRIGSPLRAQGECKIEQPVKIIFKGNTILAMHNPEILTAFGRDDLYGVTFSR